MGMITMSVWPIPAGTDDGVAFLDDSTDVLLQARYIRRLQRGEYLCSRADNFDKEYQVFLVY